VNCPNCGAERNENEKTCFLCGYIYEDEPVEEGVPEEPTEETDAENDVTPKEVNTTASKQSNLGGIIIAIIAVLVLGGGIFVYCNSNSKTSYGGSKDANEINELTTEETTIDSVPTTEENTELTTVNDITTTEPTTAAAEQAATHTDELDYNKIYSSTLSSYAAKVDDVFSALYYVFDINNDNVYELIVGSGTCEADYTYDIYTIQNEKAVLCKTIEGGNAELTFEGNNLYVMSAHMGSETVTQLNLIDTSVYEKMIFTDDNLMDYYYIGESLLYYEIDDLSAFTKLNALRKATGMTDELSSLRKQISSAYVYPAGEYSGNGYDINFSVYSSPVSNIGVFSSLSSLFKDGDLYEVENNIYYIDGGTFDGSLVGITEDGMIVIGNDKVSGQYTKIRAYDMP
jgi:hypothetical protein